MHLLCIAVNIIGFIWLTDAVGPHSWKFILVTIAALPGPVDGVPEGEIVDKEWRAGLWQPQKAGRELQSPAQCGDLWLFPGYGEGKG